jgi:hypothetical protein
VVGETVDGRPWGGDPAVAGDVADQPVLADGGGQGRAQGLSHPVDRCGGVAGSELPAREGNQLVDTELANLAVSEVGDEMAFDDDPVFRAALRQRGPSERPAAGLALGCLDGEPPAQVVGEPLVGDGVRELAVLDLLRGDPGLGVGAAVEGPAAPEATAVREAAETHLRLEPPAAGRDGARAASSPYPSCRCHLPSAARSPRR